MKLIIFRTLCTIYYLVIVIFGLALLGMVQFRSSAGSSFDTWRLRYEANTFVGNSLDHRLEVAEAESRDDFCRTTGSRGSAKLFRPDGRRDTTHIDSFILRRADSLFAKNLPPDSLSKIASWEVYYLVRGYAELIADSVGFEGKYVEDTLKVAGLKKLLASNAQQYADLTREHEDLLAFIEAETYWFISPFIKVPYELLLLLLVMTMGGLGGIVRLLREYASGTHRRPTREDYFVIPIIGAVVAIGGYVLAKSGLLLLSSAQGESTLSPYMVGLVGIVSGLLARQVIDAIAARGRKILLGDHAPSKSGAPAPSAILPPPPGPSTSAHAPGGEAQS